MPVGTSTVSRNKMSTVGTRAESLEIAHPKKAAFLEAFRITGNVKRSADAAEVSRRVREDAAAGQIAAAAALMALDPGRPEYPLINYRLQRCSC